MFLNATKYLTHVQCLVRGRTVVRSHTSCMYDMLMQDDQNLARLGSDSSNTAITAVTPSIAGRCISVSDTGCATEAHDANHLASF